MTNELQGACNDQCLQKANTVASFVKISTILLPKPNKSCEITVLEMNKTISSKEVLGQFTKLNQQQKFSPRQIQLMQLVQLPLTALEERIEQELESNPALEEAIGDNRNEEDTQEPEIQREDPYEFDEYIQGYIDDDPGSYQNRQAGEEEVYRPEAVQQQSFFEFVERQIKSLDLKNERAETIASQIIGSLDDDGYLSRKLTAISDDLLLYRDLDVKLSELKDMLQAVQGLDPAGLAARDLRECLLIQLNRKIEEEDYQNDAQLADLFLARKIVDKHFEAFSKKHYDKLIEHYEADEDEVRDALKEILRLNPKPASGFTPRGGDLSQTVIPDFLITNNGGILELTLAKRRRPPLRISRRYEKLLEEYQQAAKSGKDKEAIIFIKDKLDSARWFLEAIQQRQQTLEGVMREIMRIQEQFFLSGDEKRLKPMILKDIAEPLNLDISTISRVVSSKYVQTEYGTFLLKKFFSEGMTNEDGEEVSTIQIKNVLKEIIAAEDKRKPLNDTKLQEALKEKGYPVARRTVAKYRDQLGLPVARLRKEL